VFGFPGRTNQYLPSYAVGQVADVIDPARIGVRNISLGIMDKHMRTNEGSRLALSSKYASLSNAWKKWIGEVQGLRSANAVGKKAAIEAEFMETLKKDKALCKEYEFVLPALKKLYADIEPYTYNRTILAEVIGGSNIELFRLTQSADRILNSLKDNGGSGFVQAKDRILAGLDDFYKEYQKNIDKEVMIALMAHLKTALAPEYVPAELKALTNISIDSMYGSSFWMSKDSYAAVMAQGPTEFAKVVESDPAYRLFSALKRVMDHQLSPTYISLNDQIQALLKDYMTALMEVYPDRRFWPDANSTLRVSYGLVEPYEPRDGVRYKTQTYLDGIMEKYKPGDYEFDVHPKLISLYESKDYGQYAEDGKLPVCFIASNHTTGGNSGSPAIDANGNLIGINFDRVWEGTMSDLYYDKSICRNIMVDVRFILFVIDKFANADHLLKEMKLVHPKS
ncbi:MAG: S46 family peptidase, partial [Saprospiraceae bacterium]